MTTCDHEIRPVPHPDKRFTIICAECWERVKSLGGDRWVHVDQKPVTPEPSKYETPGYLADEYDGIDR